MSKSELSQAVAAIEGGDFSGAEGICRNVLAREPENARAWHLCGISHAQRHDTAEAICCFEKAASLAPEKANYHYNLALAYKGNAQLEQAIAAYRQALEVQQGFIEARNNLGVALMELGDNREALTCFRELVKQAPHSSDAHYNLANLLCDTGNENDAIEHYRQAIRRDPDNAAARENLGRALTEVNRTKEAKEVWTEWLAEEPENSIARHMLAALTGDEIPIRCDDEYIRSAFDARFAKNYDQQLTRIDNRVPEMIAEAINAWDENAENLDVLDAGCGTGLCSSFLRPRAQRLVGVDLSADMLAEAARRKLYDETIAAEITQYMEENPQAFDVIVASDTLCYFGELEQVFAVASKSLKREGVFIFSVESWSGEDESKDFQLLQSGRYCHREPYVADRLRDAGFRIVSASEGDLRKEFGLPVAGIVFCACVDSGKEGLGASSR